MNTGCSKRRGAVRLRQDAGFTLVEIVVAMVIIAMASATLVGVMGSIASRSADAMQQVQAANIADAYLREIMAQPFPPVVGNVDNYNNLNHNGARDQDGIVIGGLDNYRVNVTVAQSPLGAAPANQSRLITVTVTSPSQNVTVLSGYRMEH